MMMYKTTAIFHRINVHFEGNKIQFKRSRLWSFHMKFIKLTESSFNDKMTTCFRSSIYEPVHNKPKLLTVPSEEAIL